MATDFYTVLDQVLALLRSHRRVTYNALKLQFHLDDAHLAVLKEELLYGVPAVLEQKTTICCKYLCLLASIQRLRPESSGESIHVTGVDENHF